MYKLTEYSLILYNHSFYFVFTSSAQLLQIKEDKYFIHNHLAFVVKYHTDPQLGLSRIVGFEVKPFRLCCDSFPRFVLVC